MISLQRRMVFLGALLFTVGLFTGLWSAAALTGTVTLKIPRLALAAHLNGLLGGLWMLAVAFTFPFLSFTEKQLGRLVLLTAIPAYANWFITLIASRVGENGLTYKGEPANDAIAFGLQALVVTPSLLGAVYWMWGFKPAKA